jgi:queuosine precursor transporter
MANLVSGKLWVFNTVLGSWVVSAGAVVFPLSFMLTDWLHEEEGSAHLHRLNAMAAGIQVLAYLLIQGVIALPVSAQSPVSQGAFSAVFQTSLQVFLASIVAFLCSQWLDVTVFAWLRKKTGGKQFWLRMVGSTLVSQCIDTLIFIGLAFMGQVPLSVMGQLVVGNWVVKSLLVLISAPVCSAIQLGLQTKSKPVA